MILKDRTIEEMLGCVGQPAEAGRWHGEGEGPAHYFSDTPDAAWAEFLRHEEITEEADLRTIRRQMWAVEIGGAPNVGVQVSDATLSGGPSTYATCQEEARRLRPRLPQGTKGECRVPRRSDHR